MPGEIECFGRGDNKESGFLNSWMKENFYLKKLKESAKNY
jgi:hypothetical protein